MGLIHVSNWHGDTHGRSLGMLAPSTPADPLGAGNTALIAALGVTPLGFWDGRKNVNATAGAVNTWADVSGVGTYGPSLVPAFTPTPTWDGTAVLTFTAASSTNLQSTSGLTSWSLATGLSVVMVLASATAVTNGVFAEVGAASPSSLRLTTSSTASSYRVTCRDTASSLSTGNINGVFGGSQQRIIFASTAGSGGIAKSEAPTSAATTVTNVGTFGAVNAFNVGRTSSAGAFVDMALRAVLVLPGAYTNAQRDSLKTWAMTYHSAVLL